MNYSNYKIQKCKRIHDEAVFVVLPLSWQTLLKPLWAYAWCVFHILHACLFYVLTRILCILSKCKHSLSITTTTATTTTTQTPSEEGWEMQWQPLKDDYLTLLKCTPCACSCYLFDTRSLRNKKKERKMDGVSSPHKTTMHHMQIDYTPKNIW